jgi:ElaB/YqjD/DUF883 family membrane-anchored ribosome-binding protein
MTSDPEITITEIPRPRESHQGHQGHQAQQAQTSQALIIRPTRQMPAGRGVDAMRPTLQARLAIARYNVNLRLQELEGRLFVAKEKADPRNWTATPWVEVGIAALVGYMIGKSRTVSALSRLVFRASVKIGLARATTHTSRSLRAA